MSWRRDPIKKPHCYGKYNNEKSECEMCFVAISCNENLDCDDEEE